MQKDGLIEGPFFAFGFRCFIYYFNTMELSTRVDSRLALPSAATILYPDFLELSYHFFVVSVPILSTTFRTTKTSSYGVWYLTSGPAGAEKIAKIREELDKKPVPIRFTNSGVIVRVRKACLLSKDTRNDDYLERRE